MGFRRNAHAETLEDSVDVASPLALTVLKMARDI